jgi:hypothetical protein
MIEGDSARPMPERARSPGRRRGVEENGYEAIGLDPSPFRTIRSPSPPGAAGSTATSRV